MTAAQTVDIPVITLTPTQHAVLDELCKDGADDADIARRLHLSAWTIKSHLAAIRKALGVTNRTAVVALTLTGQIHTRVDNRNHIDHPVHRRTTVTHHGPPYGAVLQATRCCHRLTTDLPPRHHITNDTQRVTCTGPTWTAR